MVLPPGNYTAVVSGSGGGTGIALLEATDLRVVGATAAIASTVPEVVEVAGGARAVAQAAEICVTPAAAPAAR